MWKGEKGQERGYREGAHTVIDVVYQRQFLPALKFSLDLVMPQVQRFSKCGL